MARKSRPENLPIVVNEEQEKQGEDEEYDGTLHDVPEYITHAFNCVKGEWPQLNKDGTPKLSLANAIAALRWFLEDKGMELKFDRWRKYQVMFQPIPDDITLTRDLLNEVHKQYTLFFSPDMFKNAMAQLAAHNKFHSQIERYYNLPAWDGIPRIKIFVKDCLKAEGTDLELKIIQMHLIASVRKVLRPGTAYDMCVCLISPQGYMKSKMLSILYGDDNVLAEDISCADTKIQSERTRQGINCVELPETLGDPRISARVRVDKVKAFVSATIRG
jgi:hypothetical protein